MITPTPMTVPDISTSEGAFSRVTGAGISDWLERLPRGNPAHCAETLLAHLEEMNRSPLSRAARLEAAEPFRPVINGIAETLVRRYRNKGLPLAPEAARHAEVVQSLYRELTIAYRHAVNDVIGAGDAVNPRGREALLAFQRALLAQGRALLEAYRIYMPEPPEFWHTLNTLYATAEALKLQALPIEGERDSDETALSIKQAFLRVVILSLANPYHLMQGEAEELYRRIGRWTHFARLRAPEAGEPEPGQFVIDLESDFPPRYVARQQRHQPAAAQPRILALAPLVENLDRHIAELDDGLRHDRHASTLSRRMQRNMYMRFHNALGGRQERTDERRSTMAGVQLVDGLVRCHYILNGEQPFQPEEDELRWRRRIADATRGAAGLELAGDDWPHETAARPGQGGRNARFEAFDADADDIWARAHRAPAGAGEDEAIEDAPAVQSATFSRKNESRGGMALFQPRDCRVRTRVGELVAFSEPHRRQPPEHWRLATVRWLRTREGQGLEMGLEFLADSAHAGASKAISGPGAGSAYLRTLIAPRVNPLTDTATLITPASVYDVGTRLALNLGELVLEVQLTEQIETTHRYARFGYRLIRDTRPR